MIITIMGLNIILMMTLRISTGLARVGIGEISSLMRMIIGIITANIMGIGDLENIEGKEIGMKVRAQEDSGDLEGKVSKTQHHLGMREERKILGMEDKLSKARHRLGMRGERKILRIEDKCSMAQRRRGIVEKRKILGIEGKRSKAQRHREIQEKRVKTKTKDSQINN